MGVDPTVMTASEARSLGKTLKKGHAKLVGIDENLVDKIWKDRPARPAEKVIVLSTDYAGKDYKEKIADLRKELDKKKTAGMVISMLDEVAWLFKIGRAHV